MKFKRLTTLFTIVACLSISFMANAQSSTKKTSETSESKVQFYAENSLLQAGYNLISIGAGVEFDRYQLGLNYLGGNHQFSHAFNEVTFVNYGDLHFVHYRSEDLSAKVYLKKSRKGFYGAMLLNFLHWNAEDHTNKLKKEVATIYVVPYAGYRWFPFKKIFYVDASVGLAYNTRKGQSETLGTKNYNFNATGLEFSPNFSIGARFSLKKKKP